MMKRAFVRLPGRYVDPLFEVFDGGDFVLSSRCDIESPVAEAGVYFEDPALAEDAASRLAAAVALVGAVAQVEFEDVPDEDWRLSYRRRAEDLPSFWRTVRTTFRAMLPWASAWCWSPSLCHKEKK